jgi:hypothetical protein
MSQFSQHARLDDLLRELEAGTISGEGIARIDDLVRGDERLLQRYLERVRLVSDLRYGPDATRSREVVARVLGIDRSRKVVPTGQGSVANGDQKLLPFPVLASDDLAGLPANTSSFGGMLLSYLIAGAILLAGVLLGWTLRVAERHRADETAANNRPPLQSPDHEVRQPRFVGRITALVDCRWSEPNTNAFESARVLPGRRFALASGLMEITYDGGAKVILEGPSVYEVESSTGGYLSIGRLTAWVGARGEGTGDWEANKTPVPLQAGRRSPSSPLSLLPSPLFSVRTPTATITDLGTEFGVEVSGGVTRSHVFRGKVAVAVRASPADRATQEIVLRENESARVETVGKAAVAKIIVGADRSESARFVRNEQLAARARQARELPLEAFRRWKAFSDKLHGRDDLLAYYDFQRDPGDRRDATNSDVLRNRAKTGRKYDGRLRGTVTWVQGRFPGKQALHCGYGPDDGIHVDIPVACQRITLVAWVNVERLPRPQFNSLLTSDGWGEPGNLHWQIEPDGKMDLGLVGAKEPVVRKSSLAFGSAGLGRWQHVAVVCDPPAGKIAFYLDGELLDEYAITPANETIWIGSATIAAWEPTMREHQRDRTLEGRMDELLIFRSALSSAEIRKLYVETHF